MFIELIGHIMEPPELGMDDAGEFSYTQPNPIYESLLINTETVTLIAPSDDEDYALIFLTDGMVIMSKENFNHVTSAFKKDYIILKTSDN